MKHEFSDALRADPERFALAKAASQLLDVFSEGTIFKATACWQLPHNAGAVVEVDLCEPGGAHVRRGISADERDDPRELRWRMSRTWGDLLEDSSDRRMQRWREEGAFSAELVSQ